MMQSLIELGWYLNDLIVCLKVCYLLLIKLVPVCAYGGLWDFLCVHKMGAHSRRLGAFTTKFKGCVVSAAQLHVSVYNNYAPIMPQRVLNC